VLTACTPRKGWVLVKNVMVGPGLRIDASPYKNITEHNNVTVHPICPPVIFLTKVVLPILMSFHVVERANNVPRAYFGPAYRDRKPGSNSNNR
jgi:hypothetical protein